FNITSDQYKVAGLVLEAQSIYIRSLAAMAERSSRIHELAAAMQAYFEKEGHFPRGTLHRGLSSERGSLDWRPDQRVSWMTQLLPYLANGEYTDLHKLIMDDRNRSNAWYEEQTNVKAGMTVIPQFLAQIKSDNPIYFYVPYPNLPVKGPGMWAATHFVGM